MAVPAASDAHIRRNGDALVFAGALDRAAAAALWAQAAAQLVRDVVAQLVQRWWPAAAPAGGLHEKAA